MINAVHCAINALDALSVYYLGKRHSGSHEAAVSAIKGALTSGEFDQIAKQYGGLMALKNRAEYQPDLMRPEDAEDALKRADRIVSKAREKLPMD